MTLLAVFLKLPGFGGGMDNEGIYVQLCSEVGDL